MYSLLRDTVYYYRICPSRSVVTLSGITIISAFYTTTIGFDSCFLVCYLKDTGHTGQF